MRKNNHYNHRKARAGTAGPAISTAPQAYTAGQLETMRHGLRILARIIARAHLRRQASRAESASSPDRGVGG